MKIEIEREKLSEQLIEWMTHTYIQIGACGIHEHLNTKNSEKKLYENEFVFKQKTGSKTFHNINRITRCTYLREKYDCAYAYNRIRIG